MLLTILDDRRSSTSSQKGRQSQKGHRTQEGRPVVRLSLENYLYTDLQNLTRLGHTLEAVNATILAKIERVSDTLIIRLGMC